MNAELENLSREQLLNLAEQLRGKAEGLPAKGVGHALVKPFRMRGKTVVTVDDSKLIHRRLQSILEPMGFEIVATANNGLEGVEEVSKNKPALVLLDYKMPVMDGTQAAIEIRKLDPEVKIIVVSGTLVINVAKALLNAGVNDILVKPIDVHKFRESLEHVGFNLSDEDQ